jgi:hypothetical protein
LEESERNWIEWDVRLSGGEFVEFIGSKGVGLDVELRG